MALHYTLLGWTLHFDKVAHTRARISQNMLFWMRYIATHLRIGLKRLFAMHPVAFVSLDLINFRHKAMNMLSLTVLWLSPRKSCLPRPQPHGERKSTHLQIHNDLAYLAQRSYSLLTPLVHSTDITLWTNRSCGTGNRRSLLNGIDLNSSSHCCAYPVFKGWMCSLERSIWIAM